MDIEGGEAAWWALDLDRVVYVIRCINARQAKLGGGTHSTEQEWQAECTAMKARMPLPAHLLEGRLRDTQTAYAPKRLELT